LEDRKWHVIDANGAVLGRLAVQIADILRGKNKPTFTPHLDAGDFVVVINAAQVKFTGTKWQSKKYAWYTGYTRQRTITAEKQREKKPEEIIREAVRRMLPKNKLARQMLTKLKVFPGAGHDHQAQQPQPKEVGVS